MEKLQNFNFKKIGYGHYQVTYTSPKTNKQYIGTIDNMNLIDSVINTDNPTQKNLNLLKKYIKQS